MARYYALISYHKLLERDEFYTDSQLPDRHLSIGWGKVNPIGSTPEKIKGDIKLMYPALGGTNPSNGEKSLPLFCDLRPGDIVFVRGNAKILDIIIITGMPFYKFGNGHDDQFDYCTKVEFTPLFDSAVAGVLTQNIPEENYKAILDKGGYTLALRRIDEHDAIPLFRKILSEFH